MRRLPSQSIAAPIQKKAAIVVAGMHRSGTSALTRVLNLLGCDLPKTLLPASPGDNDLGFWESKVVIDLNSEILESAGSDWDDWTPFNGAWYDSPVSHGFYDRALAVLENEFESSRLFVLKDPRICRLLRFWIEALEGFGATPLIVVPVRNPLEVAESLNKRNGIDPSTAHLIWLRHTLEAEASSRRLTRSYVRYDDLLASWQSVAEKLGRNLRIAWPKNLMGAAVSIEQFLSPALRHHQEADSNVVKNPSISLWIQAAFRIFDRWTQGTTQESDFEELDRIREAFDTATSAFARPLNAGRQAARKNRELEREARKLAAQSKTELDAATKATADLRGKLIQAEAALAQRAREMDDAKHQLAEAHKQAAQSKSNAENSATAAADLHGRLTQAEAALAQRAREMDDAKHQLAEVHKQAAQSKSDAENSATAAADLHGRLTQAEAALAQRAREMDDVKHQLAEAHKQTAQSKSDAENSAKAAAELRGKLIQAEAALAQRAREMDSTKHQLVEARRQAAQLKSATEAAERTSAELRSRLLQVESVLVERSHQVEDKTRALAELREQLAQSKSEAEAAVKVGIELRDRLAQTESALAQRRHEAEETAAELAGAREELRHMALARKQDASLVAGFKEHVQLLLTEAKERQTAVSVLEADGRAKEQSLHKALADLQALHSTLDAERKEKAQRIAALEKDLQSARTTAEETSRERAAEIEKLKVEIAASRRAGTAEKNRLEMQVKERFAEIALLTRQHQDSERKLADAKHAARAQFRRAVKELLARGDLPKFPVLSKTLFWRRLVLRRKVALLERSGLVDAEWYLRHYQDVAEARMDAVEHYIAHGLDEGRAPNSDFD